MTRSVIRYADWTITPDTAEGAPHPIYQMECTTCDARSEPVETADDAQVWALKHSGRNPAHFGYRGVHTSFWRTAMAGETAAFTGHRDAAPTPPGRPA